MRRQIRSRVWSAGFDHDLLLYFVAPDRLARLLAPDGTIPKRIVAKTSHLYKDPNACLVVQLWRSHKPQVLNCIWQFRPLVCPRDLCIERRKSSAKVRKYYVPGISSSAQTDTPAMQCQGAFRNRGREQKRENNAPLSCASDTLGNLSLFCA